MMTEGILKLLRIIFTLASIISISSAYCDSQDECGDFMICLNNECMCDESSETFSDFKENNNNPSSQNYKTLCRTSAQIGENCDNRTTICMTDSICTVEGICQCPGDFEETRISRECKRSYDYSCNETQLCNAEKFLSCRREDDLKGKRVCRCHNEQEMIFSSLKNSCVSRVGFPCELREWMGMRLDCAQNSHCYKDDPLQEFYGVCKCNPGFVQADLSTMCESIHGKPCLGFSDPDCADGFNLECVQGTCQCKSGSIFDPRDNECKLVPGIGCEDAENRCVENAGCQLSYGPEWKLVCRCSDGYLAASSGHCHLGPEAKEDCSKEEVNPCHAESGLTCRNSSCQCKEGMVFDLSTKLCIGVHGSPCSFKEPHCVRHSACNEKGVCQCKDTFHVTDKGYCEASFGAQCSLEDDKITQICPIQIGLSCQNHQDNTTMGVGICSCAKEDTIFDKEAGRCLLRVGEHCTLKRRCITNAFCGTNKNCQCYSGYSATPDRQCMLDYLQPCNTSDSVSKECNFHIGLACVNERCNCSLGTMYNKTSTSCVNATEVFINFDDPAPEVNISRTSPKDPNSTVKTNTKSDVQPNPTVLSGLLTFTLMVIFGILVVAAVLNMRMQRRYYCLTS